MPCIRDFCASADWGFSIPSGNFNDTVINAEANICDEAVTLKAGGTEARYTINGIFRADEDPREILRSMIAACGGRLAFPGGKFAVYTAAWRGSSGTITDDDLRAGATISIMPRRPRDVIANAVRGRFFGPETNWQADDYTPYMVATTEEGQRIFTDLDQRFVSTNARCMRLAKIHLMRLRNQESVVVRGKLPLYQYLPPDVVGSRTPTSAGTPSCSRSQGHELRRGKRRRGRHGHRHRRERPTPPPPIFDWDEATEEVAKGRRAAGDRDRALGRAARPVRERDATGPYSYRLRRHRHGQDVDPLDWVRTPATATTSRASTIAASSAAYAPAAPTLSQVAGGALAGARASRASRW
jgi:hypothetical protein